MVHRHSFSKLTLQGQSFVVSTNKIASESVEWESRGQNLTRWDRDRANRGSETLTRVRDRNCHRGAKFDGRYWSRERETDKLSITAISANVGSNSHHVSPAKSNDATKCGIPVIRRLPCQSA